MKFTLAKIFKVNPSDSIHMRSMGGALWSLVATIFIQASAFITAIIFANVLGDENFGKLNMVRSAILVFVALAGSGLGMAATKYTAEYRTSNPLRAGSLLGLLYLIATVVGLIVFICCLIFEKSLAEFTVGSADLALELAIGAGGLISLALSSVQLGAIAGLEGFKRIVYLSAFESVLNLIFATFGALIWGVPGVLGGLTLVLVIMTPIKHYVLTKELNKFGIFITYQGVWRTGVAWKFILPATLVSVTAQPVEWILKLMVAKQFNGYEEVGIFAAASSLALIVQILPSQLATSGRSILPNLYASKDFAGIRRLVAINTLYSGLVGAFLALILAFLSNSLLGLYGPSFLKGVGVLYLLLLSYSMVVVSMTFTELLTACGYMWLQYIHRIIWSVITVFSGLYFFEPTAMGLASAYASGNFVFVVAQAITVIFILNGMKKINV